MKRCVACGEEKDVAAFYRRSRSSDKHQPSMIKES